MEIKIARVTSWKDVLNAARFTQRKSLLDREPSDKFKKQIIRAEHSPLRCLIFNIDFYDIPYYVSIHFVRHHIGVEKFVSTSRPDIDGTQKPREEQKKTDLVNMRLFLNAQEIINISKVRLCNKAEKETRYVWYEAIKKLKEIEPILADACAPSCIYRGFCPEIKSCGFFGTKMCDEWIRQYVNNLLKDDSKTTN